MNMCFARVVSRYIRRVQSEDCVVCGAHVVCSYSCCMRTPWCLASICAKVLEHVAVTMAQLLRARLGTDYCDITGEPDYIQDLIEQYHDAAKEVGPREPRTSRIALYGVGKHMERAACDCKARAPPKAGSGTVGAQPPCGIKTKDGTSPSRVQGKTASHFTQGDCADVEAQEGRSLYLGAWFLQKCLYQAPP